MFIYSNEHKLFWVDLYNKGRSSREVCELFHQKFPETSIPNHQTVLNCYHKFKKTGSVLNIKNLDIQ